MYGSLQHYISHYPPCVSVSPFWSPLLLTCKTLNDRGMNASTSSNVGESGYSLQLPNIERKKLRSGGETRRNIYMSLIIPPLEKKNNSPTEASISLETKKLTRAAKTRATFKNVCNLPRPDPMQGKPYTALVRLIGFCSFTETILGISESECLHVLQPQPALTLLTHTCHVCRSLLRLLPPLF